MNLETTKNFVFNMMLEIISWIFMTAIVIGIVAPLLTMMAIYHEVFDFTWFWQVADFFFPESAGHYGAMEIMRFYGAMTLLVGIFWSVLKYLKIVKEISWRWRLIILTGLITMVYTGLALSTYLKLSVDIDMYWVYLWLYLFTLVPAVILMGLIGLLEKLRAGWQKLSKGVEK